MIKKSKKGPLRNLLRIVSGDVNSITGDNLRKIMIEVGKCSVLDINKDDVNEYKYQEVPENESWRLGVARDLIDTVHGMAEVEGFTIEELKEMLNHICVS